MFDTGIKLVSVSPSGTILVEDIAEKDFYLEPTAKEYVKFDKKKQVEFKGELKSLLEKYDITLEVFPSDGLPVDSIDFCDRCGNGLTTELEEISCNEVDSFVSIFTGVK